MSAKQLQHVRIMLVMSFASVGTARLSSTLDELLAAEATSIAASKPWKYDVDILRSPQYEALAQGHLFCDEHDHLWLPVTISFDAKTTTDAWIGGS